TRTNLSFFFPLRRFPKDNNARKKWEVSLRREGFTASDTSVLCSEHFQQDDFDRTGQIVRLKDGVFPSIFRFPDHLQEPKKCRTSVIVKTADVTPPVASQEAPETCTSHPKPQPNDDHCYALPSSLTAVTAKLKEALARVESLERERKNAMAREKRARTIVQCLFGELNEKKLLNKGLKEKLEFYSDLQLDFMMQGNEYTKEHKEFALTLYVHGPKAYKYLRKTGKFPLPHPHTLQRWRCSMEAKSEQVPDSAKSTKRREDKQIKR
ncbi:THAP domain-containing protein 6-like, partial [Cyprinodon tularosa]|uniref:THAP domain-containing protein 6-like n=1 Tax=Cyprinodon tularosa TaxID=77115 RepID=UPI0018E278C6